ncbi:hypothetical protein CPC08DRAFT_635599 [Agrocybe pediades]|nr:hypothetical protein CPC08DRAFT_635599 [Agrocybe pediades]
MKGQEEAEEAAVENELLPFNPSLYGIVHLPPLPSSGSNSERTPSTTSSSLKNPSNMNRFLAATSSRSYSGSATGSSSYYTPRTDSGGQASLSGQSSRNSKKESENISNDGIGSSGGTGSLSSDDPYFSVRFRSMQDENGNHVVVGREGELVRCEDEPIRTPGAVQGFGVLVALDELEDCLAVRQVSENCTELLGLPPRYLFGLECFTEILPPDQADILWDKIEFLSDPSLQWEEEEEGGPQVFLLSGYGSPGSALPHEPNSVDGKRLWTCWCAAHRAPNNSSQNPASQGMIILEFELERDTMNPLYPPLQTTSSSPSAGTSTSSEQASINTPIGTSSSLGSEERLDRNSPLLGSDQSTAGKSSRSGSTPSLSNSYATEPTNLPSSYDSTYGLDGDDGWLPSAEAIMASTTSRSRPLPALERLRRMTRDASSYGTTEGTQPTSSRPRRGGPRATRGNSAIGMMDIFAVIAQINEQLGASPDLETFLEVVVGVVKDLTQFHRTMVYRFDELWNGQVVAELVDWSQSHDLFRGLHFPSTDIPAQARQLYMLNKVRLLYNCSQPTARIVVRSKEDLETPLDMTHCYLRAMSPIHITYLQNMGVRASMSISLMAFGQLWGLVTCHSYGPYGMRVSFPVRQMLRLLSQSISKNIERLSYAQRLHTRKLINTMASEQHPTGYIVSNADDLLSLFDADFGILVIGEGAKILGPNQHGQEILIMAEYLRLKQFENIQASQSVIKDFPDLEWSSGFEVIAGLLYVPLSSGGKDFIALLRRGQPRQVKWAGKPYKEGSGEGSVLEPRKSFRTWSETVAGRARAWTEEQLQTAGVLALVYGKFIEVWREKESALQTTKLTNLLLSNASHEVRTPLNHIINYLEMAMNGPLDGETRDNLSKSHAASKSLLFTINDLLDLTRLETGNETSFNEPFNLHFTIEEAAHLYRREAERRDIRFILDLSQSPTIVVGDAKKIRTVVQNLTANALKYTTSGSITVACRTFEEPEGLRSMNQTAVEICVSDTGCGIPPGKLESIFREFEQVESSDSRPSDDPGVGLGLAVVARIVEQLGGQLRVDSTVNTGSAFSFLIPLSLSTEADKTDSFASSPSPEAGGHVARSRVPSTAEKDIEQLVNALSSSHMSFTSKSSSTSGRMEESVHSRPKMGSRRTSSNIVELATESGPSSQRIEWHPKSTTLSLPASSNASASQSSTTQIRDDASPGKLRILIVEDNDINRTILAKRLTLNGHTVVNTTNGQEGLDKVISDRAFDLVLMDIQMPILNGFEATRRIRDLEVQEQSKGLTPQSTRRLSQILNGRIPIFAVSASLLEQQRDDLSEHGLDGWILKPIDFKRLNVILKGITDPEQRHKDVYHPGCSWEAGGWLKNQSERDQDHPMSSAD